MKRGMIGYEYMKPKVSTPPEIRAFFLFRKRRRRRVPESGTFFVSSAPAAVHRGSSTARTSRPPSHRPTPVVNHGRTANAADFKPTSFGADVAVCRQRMDQRKRQTHVSRIAFRYYLTTGHNSRLIPSSKIPGPSLLVSARPSIQQMASRCYLKASLSTVLQNRM